MHQSNDDAVTVPTATPLPGHLPTINSTLHSNFTAPRPLAHYPPAFTFTKPVWSADFASRMHPSNLRISHAKNSVETSGTMFPDTPSLLESSMFSSLDTSSNAHGAGYAVDANTNSTQDFDAFGIPDVPQEKNTIYHKTAMPGYAEGTAQTEVSQPHMLTHHQAKASETMPHVENWLNGEHSRVGTAGHVSSQQQKGRKRKVEEMQRDRSSGENVAGNKSRHNIVDDGGDNEDDDNEPTINITKAFTSIPRPEPMIPGVESGSAGTLYPTFLQE